MLTLLPPPSWAEIQAKIEDLPPWNLPFTVFTREGALKQFAELKLRSVWPGGDQIYLADIEKRLGFTLTAHDAHTWAKALTEAANALEAAEKKP